MTKLHVGDLIAVPIDSECWTRGQVVAVHDGAVYYFMFFEGTIPGPPLDENLEFLNGPCIVAGLAFDARVHSGNWKVVGRAKVSPNVRLPAYLIRLKSGLSVEHMDAKRTRPATPEDERLLTNRVIASPLLLEHALQAHYGRRPWTQSLEKYRCPTSEALDRAYFGDE